MFARHRLVACLAAVLLMAGQAPTAERQLAGRTAEEWINTLETPARLNSLKIAETLGRLTLKPGQVVADIGAGSGVFSLRLATAVRPGGIVYAVDIDQALLDHIAEAATEQGMGNVQTVLGEYDDPDLPGEIDLAFINDVLHHIEHRAEYLKNLAGYLKPTGRVAIIEFKPGQGGHVNEPELQVSQEQAATWMAAAGLKPIEEINLFDDRWFVIYGKR
jgi:ubiquinone/menaquinone biosynthesis C-methylase UbiE